MRIPCYVEEVDVEGDFGEDIPGVQVTCSRCGAIESSCGTSSRSVRRCLVLLRENCEEDDDGSHFYLNDEKGFVPDE